MAATSPFKWQGLHVHVSIQKKYSAIQMAMGICSEKIFSHSNGLVIRSKQNLIFSCLRGYANDPSV